MLEQKPKPPDPARQVRALATSTAVKWLPGFRSGTWWKQIIATCFYAFVLLAILINTITGNVGGLLQWLVILAVVITVPYAFGYARGMHRVGLKAFRFSGSALFPQSRIRVTEDMLLAPWPRVLKEAHRTGEHLLFVPMHGNDVSGFATEAIVRHQSGVFEFEGLRRVQVVKTAPIRVQGSNPAAPNVFKSQYVPLQDQVDAELTPELVNTVREAFSAWCRWHPEGVAAARSVEGVQDPAVIANRICQMVFGGAPAQASILLGANSVSYRLRMCLQSMHAQGVSAPADGATFHVEEPAHLRTLASVGGMDDLKRQIRETVGLLLSGEQVLKQLKVEVNGILLYGPPGTGKTMIAQATAGEYRLRFLNVSGGEFAAKWMGESEERIRSAFETAARRAPCLIFIDELDSMAGKRGQMAGNEQFQRQVVGQLLRSLEEIRRHPNVIVMAATNDIETLDEAIVRSGRFDYRIRVDLPDLEARRAIFQERLDEVPTSADIQLDRLVNETEGRSGADISAIVEAAKLKAVKRSVGEGPGSSVEIRQADLEEALQDRRGKDAPTLPRLTWDDLILPDETKAQLRSLAQLITDPDAGRDIGLKRPSGALLHGPPGTGKTTIAQVIASETKGRVSFLPAKGSELRSKLVGESAKKVRDLFARARASSPTIIFIDEIEALLPRRSEEGEREQESVVSEFLQQLDGIDSTPGVFVLGATNLPDKVDPAVTRGGRLGRNILIPLPTLENREALFCLHSHKLRLDEEVDFAALARMTERMSGGDIESVCQEAAEIAHQRTDGPRAVTQGDFQAVLRQRRTVSQARHATWDDLILPDETIRQLKSIVRLIGDPEAARALGLKPPRGALLYGPPGTGKTTIARVLASETRGDVSFIAATGSELVSKWVGESGKNVRDLFERARSQTPSIIFIDEIEALIPRRDQFGDSRADKERASVVTEFLQQLDGIESTPGVFVLGATNLKEQVDAAVLRGGRLSRQIEIPLPNQEDRIALFARFTKDMSLDSDVNLPVLAARSHSASGADIESFCHDAAEHAFMRDGGARSVTQQDFEAVLDRRY